MKNLYDLVIKNATVVTAKAVEITDVGIHKGFIAKLGDISATQAGEVIHGTGLHVLPGLMDTQVHFREPGQEHKEDLQTGAKAALLGGISAVFDMPNNTPSITTLKALKKKKKAAQGRMVCDFAFYAGATGDNESELLSMIKEDGCCGVKVFMGSSTGNLLVKDDEQIRHIMETIPAPLSFHSEDETRLQDRRDKRQKDKPASHTVWRDAKTALLSTQRLLKLARATGRHVHVLHVSTAQEMELLAQNKDIASVEVTPQHLLLSTPSCYAKLGTMAQMNPPLRSKAHGRALWKGIQDGTVDIIGSDHAPHTREEKSQSYPDTPSGMPGVQTLVPLMLDCVNRGYLDIQRFVALTNGNPRRLFNMVERKGIVEQGRANLTLVDMGKTRTLDTSWLASRCGWSPFEGRKVQGWPQGVLLRGERVMWEEEITAPARGQPILFNHEG